MFGSPGRGTSGKNGIDGNSISSGAPTGPTPTLRHDFTLAPRPATEGPDTVVVCGGGPRRPVCTLVSTPTTTRNPARVSTDGQGGPHGASLPPLVERAPVGTTGGAAFTGAPTVVTVTTPPRRLLLETTDCAGPAGCGWS